MELEPANIVCPVCGSGNYMRHLIGKNVGYQNIKCINCDSYFNFDELYKRRIREVLKPKPVTNADRIRAMSDEELAEFLSCIYTLETDDYGDFDQCTMINGHKFRATEEMLDWLKQEVDDWAYGDDSDA